MRLGWKKFGIELHQGWYPYQAILYLIAAFMTILLFVFLNSLQGFVLSQIIGIPTNQLGDYSGSLVFYDQIVSLVFVTVWGILSDRTGRFLVYGMAFCIEGAALILYVYSTTYSPELIIYRLLFAAGGAGCSSMLSACLADMAEEKDRGKFSGLVGVLSGIGAVVAVIALLPLPTKLGDGPRGLKASFVLVAGCTLLFGLVLIFASLYTPKIDLNGSITGTDVGPDTVPTTEQTTTTGSNENVPANVGTDRETSHEVTKTDGLDLSKLIRLPSDLENIRKNAEREGLQLDLNDGSATLQETHQVGSSTLETHRVQSKTAVQSQQKGSNSEGGASLESSTHILTRTDAQQKQEPLPFWLVMYHSTRDGILAAKDPQILLGYLASFLARSDSLSITLYVPLWVYKYYVEQGLCPDIPGAEAKDFCREAYVKASILSGVTQVFALVGAPVFGYLLDKWNRYLVVFLASLLAGLGYFFFSFQSNPLAGINYLFLFLIGFGEIGLVVSSVTLITNSSIPNHARGSIAGIASFFGAAGILVSSKVGGLLFDWYSGGPFLYLGLVHFVMLGTFMIYFLWIKRQSVRSFFVPSHVAM